MGGCNRWDEVLLMVVIDGSIMDGGNRREGVLWMVVIGGWEYYGWL